MRTARRLSPGTRRALQVGAVACFGIALYLIGSSILMFARGFGDLAPGSPPRIDWWLRFVLAFPFLIAGSLIAQFGFMRPVAEIVAGETAEAMEVSAEAAGRGWVRGAGGTASEAEASASARPRRNFGSSGPAEPEVPQGRGGGSASSSAAAIKLRCRSCGYLETEDARFCSKCGTPI